MKNPEYGVIANGTSVALIDAKGTVGRCCLPGFDAAAVFTGILDVERGGESAIIVDKVLTVSSFVVYEFL